MNKSDEKNMNIISCCLFYMFSTSFPQISSSGKEGFEEKIIFKENFNDYFYNELLCETKNAVKYTTVKYTIYIYIYIF